MRGCLTVAAFLTGAIPVIAQTVDETAQVQAAQSAAAYARKNASNDCPIVGGEFLRWPGDRVRRCVYRGGRLEGVAYILDVKPEVAARWIISGCSATLPGRQSCFKTVLRCARDNSGMMIVVSGNLLEDQGEGWKNYFFRNGMTVSFPGGLNGTARQIPLTRQEELAKAPDDAILAIRSGVTRFWRTTPAQFADRFPESGAPKVLSEPESRRQWLALARAELVAALSSPSNRLLEAWMAAHPKTLAKDKCPEDSDP